MRNKTFIALFTALLAVMFIVTGCSGPDYPGSIIPQGKGSLNLTVRGVGGRTILPKEMTYILVATPATGDPTADIILYAGSNTIYLDVGTYSLTLTASLDGTAIASGTATGVVIEASSVTKQTITLSSIGGGGGSKGTFTYDLSDFEDAVSASIKLTPIPDLFDLGGDFTVPGSTAITWAPGTGGLTREILVGAKYIILGIDSTGSGGIGGMQFAAQTADDNWGWHSWNVIGDWNDLASADFVYWDGVNVPFYLVIDVTDLSGLTEILAGAQGKLVLNNRDDSNVAVTAAYLTEEDLSGVLATALSFTGAQGKGYFLKELTASETIAIEKFEDSVDLDAGTYFVEFNIDGVIWQEVLWVASGNNSVYKPSFGNEKGFENPGDKLENLVLKSIVDGKYSELLWTDFGLLGVKGVTKDNFSDVQGGLKIFLEMLDDSDDPVYDTSNLAVADLEELIDAALVLSLSSYVDTSKFIASGLSSDSDDLESEIADFAVNGTVLSNFDWTNYDSPDYLVTFDIGAYTVTKQILPPVEPEFFDTLPLNQGNAVYRFVLPAGATFGDYKAIKVSYKMDSTNFAKQSRNLRLMGNYAANKFTLHDDNRYMVTDFNIDTANAPYIYDELASWSETPITNAGGKADSWFNITYRLVGNAPNNSFVNKPADDATGPFYFGIGIQGSDSPGKIQQVKNITMVHKTDPKKNVVTDDFFGFAGYTYADGDKTKGADSRYNDFKFTRETNPLYEGASSTFDLDLSKVVQGAVGGAFSAVQSAVYDDENKELTLTYAGTANTEAAFIPLETKAQQVLDARYLVITIEGTATNNKQFRYALANAQAGSSWQSTDLPTGNFNSLTGNRATYVGFNAGQKDLARVGYFALQSRFADGPETVKITKITIKCMK